MRHVTVLGGALAALLVMQAPASAHHLEWGAYRFEMADDEPAAGEQVFFRLVWKNTSNKPVRIPEGLWERASIKPSTCPLRGCGRRVEYARVKPLAPTPPSRFKWVTVRPGGEIERLGSFEQLFPKECKGGCKGMRYLLTVRGGFTEIGPLEKDMVVPEDFVRVLEVPVEPRVLPVRNPAAIAVKARFGRFDAKSGKMPVILAVTNTLPWPMWFPKGEPLLVQCATRMELPGDEGAGSLPGFSGGSGRGFDESQAVLLKPGKQHAVKGSCSFDAKLFPKAVKRFATLTVGVQGYFHFQPNSSGLAVHHFDARHTTKELQVK